MTQKNMHEFIKGPAVAVDTVVLGIEEGRLKVLVIQIGDGDYKDQWAVPGGLIQLGESPEEAAIRVLEKKTNIKTGHLEQLYTFGDPDRDKRGQIISISYFLLVKDIKKYSLQSSDFYKNIAWVPADSLPDMAFDHKSIVDFAVNRLKGKISYTNIVYSLLPKEFTLTELQSLYEVILGKSLDKRNFRKRMLSIDILEETQGTRHAAHRPAKLFRFKKESLVYFD